MFPSISSNACSKASAGLPIDLVFVEVEMTVEIRAVTPDDAEGFNHVFDVVAKERK